MCERDVSVLIPTQSYSSDPWERKTSSDNMVTTETDILLMGGLLFFLSRAERGVGLQARQ